MRPPPLPMHGDHHLLLNLFITLNFLDQMRPPFQGPPPPQHPPEGLLPPPGPPPPPPQYVIMNQ